ncbi:MAG: acylphosphatase [Acidobacteriia bacterium]|nr:acylphosphatase [Terriglobia bacterium]
MSEARQARRFFVSGMVQGVGFRYYAQHTAQGLLLAGYVRNRVDGRVEAYAVGAAEQLAAFQAALRKGPYGAVVRNVLEEAAALEARYAKEFSIIPDL